MGVIGRGTLILQLNDTLTSQDVDIIIHNGAQVHWVKDYATLRATNVLSTVELVKLASNKKPKRLVFVSSTSVLDTDFYLDPANIPDGGLPESDPLSQSSRGLANGYGQTKWVSESLLRAARDKGLDAIILRPGYVTGESIRGTTITDDFLVRIWKGCIQLHSYPDLGDDNLINMMPVDGVAHLCVEAAVKPTVFGPVINAVGRTMSFNEYLGELPKLGYNVKKTAYDEWKLQLEDYVRTSRSENKEEHALLPLYHLAVSDLPADSRSPVLATANVTALLAGQTGVKTAVDEPALTHYIAYLVEIGFLPKPSGVELPEVNMSAERRQALENVEGRGKISNGTEKK
jgi:L-aminoadipate-semialdehyde dehydrogenase